MFIHPYFIMHFLFVMFLLPLLTFSYFLHAATLSSTQSVLAQGSSLFVEKKDHLVSPNGLFTAGFHEIGQNAYCFAIWFTQPIADGSGEAWASSLGGPDSKCIVKIINQGGRPQIFGVKRVNLHYAYKISDEKRVALHYHAKKQGGAGATPGPKEASPLADGKLTLVWMANRDEPVNGKRSKFSLWKSGNLVLTDAGRRFWSTDTKSNEPVQLKLLDSGNLVLTHMHNQSYIWQSFSSPTDTILPNQPFTKVTALTSSRSLTNFSSGYYKFYFDNDNVLKLRYNSDEISSIYFPRPWLLPWQAGRNPYTTRIFAMLDSKGRFTSTDDYNFNTSDNGKILQRILTLDVDGNIRVYTLNKRGWSVSWQALSTTCAIHGICGPNSLCTYIPESGRTCACMHGYKAKNKSDSSLGCEPTFEFSKPPEHYDFIKIPFVEFYGFDSQRLYRSTLNECQKSCLDDSNCKGFQYTFNHDSKLFECFVKTLLYNGFYKGTPFNSYLKLPKTYVLSYNEKVAIESQLVCSTSEIELNRPYDKDSANGTLKFMLWFSSVLGGIEVLCFLFFYYFTKAPSSTTNQAYLAIATGFKRFTYDEIVKMSRKFSEEIGRGGGGIVYKGKLPDNRVVAIKVLHDAIQGEAEFLAEMSTIGRINHMNLIETYGYCAEGKHRILVYEYMENGSLAQNLSGASKLGWQKRFEIAIGVAKGLAYLHEECLEWVLHCDVKPHNILLDSNYNPKVADFGLSKLFHQDVKEDSAFSRIRGTRGYMAPEWVFNLPITSKVDVYSYGMVVLEMITGRSPTRDQEISYNEIVEKQRLVDWVKEKVHKARENLTEIQIMEILDPMMIEELENLQIKNLLCVAIQCVEEDKDVRPTMSEVVKMLLHSGND